MVPLLSDLETTFIFSWLFSRLNSTSGPQVPSLPIRVLDILPCVSTAITMNPRLHLPKVPNQSKEGSGGICVPPESPVPPTLLMSSSSVGGFALRHCSKAAESIALEPQMRAITCNYFQRRTGSEHSPGSGQENDN